MFYKGYSNYKSPFKLRKITIQTIIIILMKKLAVPFQLFSFLPSSNDIANWS